MLVVTGKYQTFLLIFVCLLICLAIYFCSSCSYSSSSILLSDRGVKDGGLGLCHSLGWDLGSRLGLRLGLSLKLEVRGNTDRWDKDVYRL